MLAPVPYGPPDPANSLAVSDFIKEVETSSEPVVCAMLMRSKDQKGTYSFAPALWRSHIHPGSLGNTLTTGQLQQLAANWAAIDRSQSNLEGGDTAMEAFVWMKSGGECPACRSGLESTGPLVFLDNKLVGYVFCPECQAEPSNSSRASSKAWAVSRLPPPEVQIAEAMWETIKLAHPTHRVLGARGPLPGDDGPGCVYAMGPERNQIVIAIADSLKEARDELLRGDSWLGARALWIRGSRSQIREESPLLRELASPLQTGRPIKITGPMDWAKAPAAAGIYRIYLRSSDGDEEVYVGRSRNLSARPRRHELLRARSWQATPGVTAVELLPVKPSTGNAVWSVADLDEAEARHIARARERQADGGPRVLNVTTGKNGPGSRPGPHMFVWLPAEV